MYKSGFFLEFSHFPVILYTMEDSDIYALLLCSDDVAVGVKEDFFRRCLTILHLVEDLGDDFNTKMILPAAGDKVALGDCNGVIPLNTISSNVLRIIVRAAECCGDLFLEYDKFMAIHGTDGTSIAELVRDYTIPKELEDVFVDILGVKDASLFMKVPPPEVIATPVNIDLYHKVLIAINFLDIPVLVHVFCMVEARLIKNKSQEDLSVMFGVDTGPGADKLHDPLSEKEVKMICDDMNLNTGEDVNSLPNDEYP